MLAILLLPLLIALIGTQAKANNNTVITLSVDGDRRGFSTDADTVSEVLARADVHISKQDLVEPALDTVINSQVFYINVYRARPAIVIDGGREYYVSTPYQNPRLIAERSAGLALFLEDDFDVELIRNFADEAVLGHRVAVKRSVPVTVEVDGHNFELRSLKPTVGEMLLEKGIVTDDEDIVSPGRATPLTAGLKISVIRVGKEVIAIEEVIPTPVENIFDSNKPNGYEEVRQAGSPGRRLVTYKVNYENGVEVSRQELQVVIITHAVPRIVVRGVTFAGGVWAALRQCESGGNYQTNTGNGFYGAYQFDASTWRSNAPPEWNNVLAHQAPPDIQDLAAQNLQSRRGWHPWPSCARKLGLI